jgi:hypothetical protein
VHHVLHRHPNLIYAFSQIRTLPLYAALPPAQQFIVFAPAPPGTRKCIIATNIAETSITVPGVKYVIDSGKFKEKNHIVGANGHPGEVKGFAYHMPVSNSLLSRLRRLDDARHNKVVGHAESWPSWTRGTIPGR